MKSFLAKLLAKHTANTLSQWASRPLETQQSVFRHLISAAKHTAFGKDFGFHYIKSVADFQKQVPVRDYEANKSYFDRIYKGEADVSWAGKPLYMCKTSGTTSGAKYIPITRPSIQAQIRSARDILLMYVYHTGNADFLKGKMMFLSGSPELEINPYGMKIGRLSGIVNHFVPAYLQTNKTPSYETNCIEDWEEKVHKIVRETSRQDLRLISGIPPWVQMFFEEAARQNKQKAHETWQHLQLFVQGGVDFSPYRPIFDDIFKGYKQKPQLLETYPASEGFFAIQDNLHEEGLLLLLDNGIFYEFIHLEEYGKPHATRLSLAEVELGRQYAMVVSTNAGLWAYDLGDTVKFVSLSPYKIRVTGRVKHFLSLFGEHVIGEEVNQAILKACEATGATFQEFTVAPYLSPVQGSSYHEWLVEFIHPPLVMELFVQALDQSLRRQNAYYNDLREGKMLLPPKVTPLPLNSCNAYMKSEGKLGGQNKFPRLTNDRILAEKLLAGGA